MSHRISAMRALTIALLVTGALLLTGVFSGAGWAQSYHVEDLRIPVPGAGAAGLEAVLVRPDGGGRNPLALITNGSPRSAQDRPAMTAMRQYPQALAFARRGFTAVAVLRRGYGSSGGGWAETFGSCGEATYLASGRAGAADLRAAIASLGQRADVDASRVLAVGVSAGGFAIVALTAEPPPGLVAAISFAGGRGSEASDTVCAPDRLVSAFGAFGRTSRVPMLWVTAANDHFFPPDLAERFRAAFAGGGGEVRFVRADPFGDEGHFLFSPAGIPVWTPMVDRFLRERNLVLRASVLPPPPVAEVAPPPGLSGSGAAQFAAYLAAPPHKAFAMGTGGGFGWVSRRRDARDAAADALQACAQHGANCRMVMQDDAAPR